MQTSLSAIFHGPGVPVELRPVPIPPLAEGEILVRVSLCTLCGSDLHTYHGRRTGPTPSILGHEIVGVIADLGRGTSHDLRGERLHIGDRVSWSMLVSCGECFYCRRNLTAKCERLMKFGHEPVTSNRPLTGGLAEYCVLPSRTQLVKLPQGLSDQVVCPLNCATATVACAFRQAGEIQGATILIQGAGGLGLTASAMALMKGAAEIIVCDLDEKRRRQAAAFGATKVAAPEDLPDLVKTITEGRGVDIAVEMTGASEAVASGIPLVRMGGTYVLVGSVKPGPSVLISPELVVRRWLTIRGIHNYLTEDLMAALDFLENVSRGKTPMEDLVGKIYPLAEVEKAFDRAGSGSPARIGVQC